MNKLPNLILILFLSITTSCSTLQSTVDSVSEAGSYVYDSIKFWEDDDDVNEEISEAIIIEEAVEVPEFAIQDENFNRSFQQYMPQNSFVTEQIYRSARQYYFVSPNGSPIPAPPAPPFPQYSIEQNQSPFNETYSMPSSRINEFEQESLTNSYLDSMQIENIPNSSTNLQKLTVDEEMEIFGIENNCIRVAVDYVNGGYRCDDFN